jgi:hypothetical protein
MNEATEQRTYERRVALQCARERAFDSIATLDGVRGWWTPAASGSTDDGGELRLGFDGLDERIVMHVDRVAPPAQVEWLCVTHTSSRDWDGTRLSFELVDSGPAACELHFRHSGIDPELVEPGWERFLESMAAYSERGAGAPYTAPAGNEGSVR